MRKLKSTRICKCGHSKAVHKHDRRGSDCSQCKCRVHPDLGFDVFEISACRIYPENCAGYCWQFRDRRKLRRKIADILTRR